MSSPQNKPCESKSAAPHEKELANDAFLEAVALRFKMLGEPMRLKLVRALFNGEKTVSELVESTGGNQANISRHLAALAQVHILHRRKSGLKVYYSIADASVLQLCSVVCGGVKESRRQQEGEWSI